MTNLYIKHKNIFVNAVQYRLDSGEDIATIFASYTKLSTEDIADIKATLNIGTTTNTSTSSITI